MVHHAIYHKYLYQLLDTYVTTAATPLSYPQTPKLSRKIETSRPVQNSTRNQEHFKGGKGGVGAGGGEVFMKPGEAFREGK